MISTTHLNALLNAPSIEELWDMHVAQMADYGFDRLIYGFTRYRTPTSLGDPDDFVLLSNQTPEYMNTFIGDGLYHHAPMVRWALDNEGACSWRVLAEMLETETLTPQERKVVDFNASMGVTCGYSISFKSMSPRTKGAIALTAHADHDQADCDKLWDKHGDDIILLNNIVHLRILTLPYEAPGRSLTRRQKEVLGWVGDGKTIQDIALLMELTPATVEKHLRLAREALSVETTAQAVLKAAFQNQIFVLHT
ncbi:LuxR family transcriptional regulator [Roseovarius sp.]|uniref:LuxR family transcriptional regulator n=1 Tax=Roseovarius sp. TaxID=1486281 RepID=UPI003D0B5442